MHLRPSGSGPIPSIEDPPLFKETYIKYRNFPNLNFIEVVTLIKTTIHSSIVVYRVLVIINNNKQEEGEQTINQYQIMKNCR